MRVRTLLYHDVVAADPDASGFAGPAAARYKITTSELDEHLAALATARLPPCITAHEMIGGVADENLLLTVDDGGVSAMHLAERVEGIGWRAHFFVTTNRIGTAGFLTSRDIRELNGRGHVIGAHSHTHPYRISALPFDQLEEEWRRSTAALSEILGAAVQAASVPGGFFAPRVAEAAARTGVRVLFTSEPTTKVVSMHGCLVTGRFTVYRGMSAAAAVALARGSRRAALKQAVVWNAKKAIKQAAAPVWETLRRIAFRQS